MSEPTEFTIGSEVSSSDGPCGELRRVVIDPIARALTHLVVEPKHGREKGRLVPINLATPTTDGVSLACTTAEFEKLDQAEVTQFIPGGNGRFGYGQDQMLSWPYYGLGVGSLGMGGVGMGLGMQAPGPVVVTNDSVSEGEVEVRRGDHVSATDGAIGRVRGLDEGHLWGQKRVAIPISAVKDVEDGVRLNLTKDEVRDLPAVEVDEPD